MISCTLGGDAPTFWLQISPFPPNFIVAVECLRSQVNFLIIAGFALSVSTWSGESGLGRQHLGDMLPDMSLGIDYRE